MGRIQQLVLFLVSLYIAMWFINIESRYSAEYLKDKRIVITGASSGVGEQLAYHYAKLNTNLLLVAKRPTKLTKVAEKCRSLGAKKTEIHIGDLTLQETLLNLTSKVERTFGGKIDQLLLSHGIYEANKWSGSSGDLNRLQQAMNTNFVSFVDVASKLVPHISRGAGGAIGVVSGLTGLVPAPILSEVSASHAAQQRFFSALRQELAESTDKVSVTTVILGMVSTEKSLPIYRKWFPLLNFFMSTSADGAAEAIAKGVTDGVDQVVYPFRALLQRYFYDLYQEVYEFNFHFISG